MEQNVGRIPFVLLSGTLLILWSIAPQLLGVPEYVFPPLPSVFREAWLARESLFADIVTTTLEATAGCLLGGLVAIGMGALMAISRAASSALLPYVVAANSIPVVAVAPLVVLWFGHGFTSKVIVAAFLSFFPLAVNTYRGLISTDQGSGDLFLVLGALDDHLTIHPAA